MRKVPTGVKSQEWCCILIHAPISKLCLAAQRAALLTKTRKFGEHSPSFIGTTCRRFVAFFSRKPKKSRTATSSLRRIPRSVLPPAGGVAPVLL
jgi:hypothetical protein